MNLQPVIVDNDDILCFLINKLLKLSGFPSPIWFLSGGDALERIKKEQNSDTTYAIFLDINMPEMNGWQFIEHLESITFKSKYFIYIITSSVDDRDKVKAYQYKSVYNYYVKPLKQNDFELLKKSPELRPFFK
ncbi:response regulator [Gaetbulibacter aestuarii]|uniref:Response regulator n=1 Tax=Gaetbulibacter aestuarii TaxID=1502358 RepID=A0ABW7N2H3_9FLAO